MFAKFRPSPVPQNFLVLWMRDPSGICTQHSGIPNADMHFCQRHSSKEARTMEIKSCSSTIQVRGSIVVSISACHAEDPGSIPGHGVGSELMAFGSATNKVQVALWPRVYTRSGFSIVSTRLQWGLILGPSLYKSDALTEL